MTGRINIGTSGWSYPEWMGSVYPVGMKDAKRLDFYVRLFNTCEINTSFYNIPSDIIVRNWDKKTTGFGFTFAAKLFKGFTHEAKLDLRKIGNGLNLFMNRFHPLDEKIHSYLLQLPPSFTKENPEHLERLGRFFEFWQRNWPPEKLVVEFRNKSWFNSDTYELLKEHEATYCIMIEPELPQDQVVTNPAKAYIRFHGFGTHPMFNYKFTDKELQDWTRKISSLAEKVDTVHVYFNNHFSGYAVQNAMTLMDYLDMPHASLKKVQNAFSPMKGQTSLF